MSANSSAQKAQKLFVEAATKLQRGDAAGARRGLEKVSRIAPNSAAVWYNLALSAQHLGFHSKAIREYEKSLRITPNQVDALVNLGLSYKHMDNVDAAKAAVQQALDVEPGHIRALNLLGSLSGESGDSAAALNCFRKALGSDPGNIDVRQNLAKELFSSGESEQALEVLDPLLNQPGTTQEQQELHAEILLRLRRFDLAESLIEELKRRFPDEESVLVLEMTRYELTRDYFSVIDIAQKILELFPENSRVWGALGSAYFQLDSIDKAKSSYQKAIEHSTSQSEYRNNLGLAYASLGDREQAEKNYRAAIEINSKDVEAYRNLISMRKFASLDDPDVKALQILWERDDCADDSRCSLAFALGKVYDDCGLHAQAFQIYEVGNRIMSEKIAQDGFDFDQYFGHMERITEIFCNPPPVTAGLAGGSVRPIYVLGMSRSGTTLVEQIISRHPDVTGCGELPCIERAIARLEKDFGEMRVYPDDFLVLAKSDLESEVREYLNWVVRLHNLKTGHFTDKMPFNFAHIWLIKALFPDAAIVYCRRHPLDVILSNYFQLYGSEINFVYDLQVLARYYINLNRLMNHWYRVFPGEIYQVQYEDLVVDSENQIRSLIKNVGLGWDRACLDSESASMPVRTASIWQVRQGIYTSSKERWRNYEQHLSPAIEILQTEKILDEDLCIVN